MATASTPSLTFKARPAGLPMAGQINRRHSPAILRQALDKPCHIICAGAPAVQHKRPALLRIAGRNQCTAT